jgi:glycosyltransferase involved in cell wall biosynthesis
MRNNEMKILQVAPYFYPHTGGQEKYIFNLSKYLVKMGHEVHVITSNFPKTKEYEEIEGMTVERQKVLMKPLRNPITLGSLTMNKIIRNFDIVHAHDEHNFSPMIAAYFKTKNDFPMVLTNHGQLKFGDHFSDTIVQLYDKSIGKSVLNKCDVIVVNSFSDKKYFISINPNISDRIKILPNSIDPEEYRPYLDLENTEFLKKYNIYGKDIILFVGQVIERKGIEYLIRAIPHIINKTSKRDFVIMVIGSEALSGGFLGKAKKIAKNLKVEKFIIFTGKIPLDELINAYKSASIFVLPSFSEGLPTVILEAMYFNLPVISTDIPGIRDHCKGVSLLVQPKDEKALAAAIIELLDNTELAKELSKQGKKLVQGKYLWKNTAKEYEKIYLTLLDGNHE